jgi:HAD superfamily hydrolase (TIGR01509 family)
LREPEKIMRKFLLWDQDGVLVDTERWFFIATQECLGELDVELDQATYLQYMAAGRSYWELALDHGRSDVVIAEKRRERDRRYQSYLATKDITIDGVLETLHALCQQYRMAIVSTSTRADVALIHRSRVLLPFFEFVLTIEDYAQPKPAPDPYCQALRRFGAVAREAVVIEDSARGLRSAMAAGIDCVVVYNAFTASQDFSGAWRMLHTIRELPGVLASSLPLAGDSGDAPLHHRGSLL